MTSKNRHRVRTVVLSLVFSFASLIVLLSMVGTLSAEVASTFK
jgi:hypothetical protein